jgi:hypothetical protein
MLAGASHLYILKRKIVRLSNYSQLITIEKKVDGIG